MLRKNDILKFKKHNFFFVVCAIFIIEFILSMWVNRAWYTDGAYQIISVLKTESITNELPGRMISIFLREFPLVLAIKMGFISNIWEGTFLFNLSRTLLYPIGFLLFYLNLNNKKHVYFYFLFMSFVYFNYNQILADEAHVMCAFLWPLMATLTNNKQFNFSKSGQLIIYSLLVIKSYEIYQIIGLIPVLTICYMLKNRGRISWFLVLILLIHIYGMVDAYYWATKYYHPPGKLEAINNLLNAFVSFDLKKVVDWELLNITLIFALITIATFLKKIKRYYLFKEKTMTLVQLALVSVTGYLIFTQSTHLAICGQYNNRLLTMFLLASGLFIFTIIVLFKIEIPKSFLKHQLFIIIVLLLTKQLSSVFAAFELNDYHNMLKHIMLKQHGVIQIAKTKEFKRNNGFRKFTSCRNWMMPDLSLLLQNENAIDGQYKINSVITGPSWKECCSWRESIKSCQYLKNLQKYGIECRL